MARRIELKTVAIYTNGPDKPALFNYAEVLGAMLRFAPQGKGLMLDDVLKSVEALKPLEKAVAEKAEYVTFSEDQYRTLRAKLDEFQFAFADPAIAEFGLAVRDAKEIT